MSALVDNLDARDGVEIGGYLRDHRRSTYGGYYRFRDDIDHVAQFETAQVLGKGFVGVASVRYIRPIPEEAEGGPNQVQFGAGFDWYHGDYDFLTFRVISDPREAGRYTFVLSHRFYLREWLYLEPAIMPRTVSRFLLNPRTTTKTNKPRQITASGMTQTTE